MPLAFAVLYRDGHLLAVAKPRGLPSVPNGGFLTHTLLHIVQRVLPVRLPPAPPRPRHLGPRALRPHRRGAARGLAAWREGRVDKTYRALVRGIPSRESFTVEAPIGRYRTRACGHVFAACPGGGGKAALSHVRLVAPRGDDAIVEVRIPTGRPHQIRIHLASAGHPLVGDPLYGPGGQPLPEPGLPGDGGYRLHAWKLGLRHPITGEHGRDRVRAAYPCGPEGRRPVRAFRDAARDVLCWAPPRADGPAPRAPRASFSLPFPTA